MAHYKDDGIRVEEQIPPGYIGLMEFSKRCGVGKTAITNAKKRGTFPIDEMCWVLPRGSKQYRIYFDWATIGKDYLANLPSTKKPKVPRPKNHVPRPKQQIIRNPIKNGATPQSSPIEGDTLDALKRRKEQLEIQKRELELQKAKNEVLELEKIVSLMFAVGIEVRQKLESLETRVGSMFAATSDPEKITKLFCREKDDIMKTLDERFAEYATEKTPS